MEELTLKIVGFHAIEVSDAQGADARGGEVKRGRATETARADDEHSGGGELLLAGKADLGQHEVPAVAREFGGGKGRRGGSHESKESR